MKTGKIGAIIIGTAALLVIGYAIYKILSGKEVGFQEVVALAALAMLFVTHITWRNKKEKDGTFADEEPGR